MVVLLAFLLIGAGWAAFRALPIDAFPDVTNVQVTVISQAATLSPLEVEQLVTYPIEQACAGLPHSTEVRSLSKFGLSMVTVVFEDGTDIYWARQLITERLSEVKGRLPDGIDSLLGSWFSGGTELSGGEWQRLSLARAVLRDARILLLDEPTSAMDSWAETDWVNRFRDLAHGRTAIIISHRLTTAMRADMIHVMDHGAIIESGSHRELLERGGRYAEAWSAQMKAHPSQD